MTALKLIGPNSVRTHWRLHATTKSSGRKVKRQGIETIHFNPKGLITTVEVRTWNPARIEHRHKCFFQNASMRFQPSSADLRSCTSRCSFMKPWSAS